MAIPSTKATFKEYCLRSLGKPVIDINVDDVLVVDSFFVEIDYFLKYHFDGVY